MNFNADIFVCKLTIHFYSCDGFLIYEPLMTYEIE